MPANDQGRSRFRLAAEKLAAFLPPLAVYLFSIPRFPFPPGINSFSDLAVSHIPNLIFLRSVLLEWRTVPLWSPAILSGAPFAANPLAGLWYPPGWMALLLPVPLGFNLLVCVHLLIGGFGMKRFLVQLGISESFALFGAWAFMAMPKLMGHFAAGHLTLLYAVPLTPWLLLSAFPSSANGRRGYTGGLILGLIFLADPRWAFYSGILWAGWSLSLSPEAATPFWFRSQWLARQMAVAALVAAPLALPLVEYAALTTRTAMTPAEILIFSLPPARLLGFIFPDFGGSQEWMTYPGFVLALTLPLALTRFRSQVKLRFWLAVFFIAIYFSLGEYVPGMVDLAGLPGFSLVRVPSRALFIASFALTVIGVMILDQLNNGLNPGSRRIDRLLLAASGFFIFLFGAGVIAISGRFLWPYVWGGLVTLLSAYWLARGAGGKEWQKIWVVGIFLLGWLDWTAVHLSQVELRDPRSVLTEKSGLAAALLDRSPENERQPFRTYSPSYSLPQQTAASYGIELADGVDPLQLREYASFMEAAAGVPSSGYSVTVPPYQTGDPADANSAFQPDVGLLGLLNVRYVLSEFEIVMEGLDLISVDDHTFSYHNRLVRPRAWVEDAGLGSNGYRENVQMLSSGPNHIVIDVQGPGQLVLSEIDYPGWRATINGEPVTIQRAHDLLRSVELRQGQNRVEFRFQPATVYAGLLAAFAGLAIYVAARHSRPSRMDGARHPSQEEQAG